MHIKGIFIILVKLLLLVTLSQVAMAYGQSSEGEAEAEAEAEVKTDLQDKHYRQALYYYFQDAPEKALSQVEQSKIKLGKLDSRSSLFEAGLQLSAGLLQQAKQTLVNFDELLTSEENDISARKSAKANELRLISLLSLTDQYLQQGNYHQAKDTLVRIKSVSPTYYPQYHVLSQLTYWPDETPLLMLDSKENAKVSSPYIQLNEALRFIEQSQYQQAITLLNGIKVTTWHKPEEDFWKTLFLNETSFSSQSDENKMAIMQGQAIQDYAQLLLAQIYISQQRYSLAFNELKTFPEQSPYAESALFLFAFASQQVKQYDLAFNLLNVLYQQYPHSSLGWQSAELMAEQVSEQQSLAKGVSAYQRVERFFLQRQQDLAAFTLAFQQSDDLLDFSHEDSHGEKTSQGGDVSTTEYLPKSVWLQQALYDAELASLYQALLAIDSQTKQVELLLTKTVWLAEIIALNQQRKKKIIAVKEARNHPEIFTQLTAERDRLSAQLFQQVKQKNHSAFANKTETKWLERIAIGHNALTAIGDQKNTQEYQQRLARVEGVLSWQLTQQYPQRAWQHHKQLQQVNNAIAGVYSQQQRLASVEKTDNNLSNSIQKHENSVEQLKVLLSQGAELRNKVSDKIRIKVNHYIDEQNVALAEHLLSTRQGMAKVLELMASRDKKLSLQLTSAPVLYQSDNGPSAAGSR